jgi:hypothetical protein
MLDPNWGWQPPLGYREPVRRRTEFATEGIFDQKKGSSSRIAVIAAALLLASSPIAISLSQGASAQVVSGGGLISGKTVVASISAQDETLQYTFPVVSGHHVTLAFTNPKWSLVSEGVNEYVYEPDGSLAASTTTVSSDGDVNFTPDETGTASLTLSPTGVDTGSERVTFAKDVTGKLTGETAKGIKLNFLGQDADVTFPVVAAHHITLVFTDPKWSLVSEGVNEYVYEPDGSLAESMTTGGSAGDINFTPDQTGTATLVISPTGLDTGSETVTFAKDVTGKLTSGSPLNVSLDYLGQNADLNFPVVSGHHVTLAFTNPKWSPVSEGVNEYVYEPDGSLTESMTTGGSAGDINFTPDQTGMATLTISPTGLDTGSETVTFAKDVTGELTAETAKDIKLKFLGQNAAVTFPVVDGSPVTLNFTNPEWSPAGEGANEYVYGPDGGLVASTTTSDSANNINFTADQTGTATLVVSPTGLDTGSETVTLA